jgi:hypothetical protein
MSDDSSVSVPMIQLRIPGPWTSPAQLNDALRDASLPWMLNDEGFVNSETDASYEWGVTPHDDEIADLFAHDGRASAEQIARIASHNVKVHISGPGGDIEAASAIVEAATALLSAGGFGLFVDNSGAAHLPGDWYKLAGDSDPGGLYWTYVVLGGSDELVWSVGMHCLGLREAEYPYPPDQRTAWEVLHNFLGYTYMAGIEVQDGEAIGGEEGAEFRVRHQPCTRFSPGTAFFNPYGVWRLEKLEDDER